MLTRMRWKTARWNTESRCSCFTAELRHFHFFCSFLFVSFCLRHNAHMCVGFFCNLIFPRQSSRSLCGNKTKVKQFSESVFVQLWFETKRVMGLLLLSLPMSYRRLRVCFIEPTTHGKAKFSQFRSPAEIARTRVLKKNALHFGLTLIDFNEGSESNYGGFIQLPSWADKQF